jgi:hypothetical protein
MFKASKMPVPGVVVCALGVLSFWFVPQAGAQQDSRDEVKVTESDLAAVRDAGPGLVHGLAAHTPGARQKLEGIHRERAQHAAAFRDAIPHNQASSQATSQAVTGPFFYPADLASGGGPTLATTTFHAVYVNASGSIASNWGNPEGFLRDLNESTFIHLSDQYVGTSENDRYRVGRHARVRYGTRGATLYESDIAAIAHAVALEHGSGGDHVYHVFLPKGTDTCFDITPQNPTPACYSPDNPATFAFCGYHDAWLFNDIGIVLFTVEPWMGPGSGCEIATPAPNGVLADSQDNTLSHESFETITDPLPGLGFLNLTGDPLTFSEIGDECVLFNFSNAPGAYAPPTFSIHGKKYAVQPEYSNTYHGCATVP